MHRIILILGTVLLCLSSCGETSGKNKESDNVQAQQDTSDITCPSCGHTETEILPEDQCQIGYNCKNCDYKMTPQGDDCCVYCSYGNHKCPSKQVEN